MHEDSYVLFGNAKPGSHLENSRILKNLKTRSFTMQNGCSGSFSSCLVKPVQPYATLAHLPNEILYQILKPLLPILDRDPRPNRISYLHNPSMASPETYRIRLKFFADYRLICRTMDDFITSLLFEELILFLRPWTRLKPVITIFEHFAHLIRSLAIEVPNPLDTFGITASQVIQKGLGKCTNLQRLQCHGCHHLFALQACASSTSCYGSFPSGISSISITLNTASQFEALASVGFPLRSLRLHGGGPQLQRIVFNSSSPFPQLEELTLQKNFPLSETQLLDFLRHVGPYDDVKRGCKTSLRTLNVVNAKMSLQGMQQVLLTNEIGVHLTTLRWIWASRFTGTGCDLRRSIGPILAILPNLKNLYLACPDFPSHFGWVPPSLEHLTLFVAVEHRSTIPWLLAYIDWVQHRWCRPLRSITSLSTPLIPEILTQELMERCREIGARPELVHDPWMNTDGIKVVFRH